MDKTSAKHSFRCN